MPIYDFTCTKCEITFDKLVRNTEAKVVCTECGGETSRLFPTPAFKVKGGYDSRLKI